MDSLKTNILVVYHKQTEVYSKDIYTPILVGKDINNLDFGTYNDNDGENISNKNQTYCELTAQYWAWKNIHSEYVGLCHYRRYFEEILTQEKVEKYMADYDVILPAPMYRTSSMFAKMVYELSLEDTYIYYKLLCKMYPDYKKTIDDYMNGFKDYGFNMFVCSKSTFDEFAKWQFDFLFECEKYIMPSSYTRMKRIYGYFGEFLLPIWMLHNKKRIKEMELTVYPGGERIFPKWHWLKKYSSKLICFLMKDKGENSFEKIEDLVAVGIKQDKIDL